ncbi:MAG: hypothetical protein NZ556_00160 [Fimbriimonadales bacterium]|nr:hypothetical protein [Fimbriimonadales bacterium]
MKVLSLLMCLTLFLPTSALDQKFPSLGVDASLLERTQEMQVSLTEARRAFERTLAESLDPRQVVIHTRVLYIAVLAFRNDLAFRYAQRADAPVSPPISDAEAERLLQFIQELMKLEATLLALEESALQEVAKQYPALEKNGALAQWRQYNRNMRKRLAERSVRTGLSVKQFPRIRWSERLRVAEQSQRLLQECEYVPASYNENNELLRAAEVKLPRGLERFGKASLPWSKEETAHSP